MPISKKRKVGDTGEDIACKYLINKGFSIIERNYLRKCGEIDIVAEKDVGDAENNKKLHFVEVKSVSREILSTKGEEVSHETTGYRPEDNVSQTKLKKIKKTIQLYFIEKKIPETSAWSFDVMAVFIDFNKRIGRVNVIKDIII